MLLPTYSFAELFTSYTSCEILLIPVTFEWCSLNMSLFIQVLEMTFTEATNIMSIFYDDPKQVEDIPNGFSFEIQDNPGARTILLKKNYQDETIKIEVDEPSIPDEDVQEDDDDDQDKNVEDTDNPASLPLIVSITKGKGQIVEFGITAYPDEITIDTLSIKDSESSEDKLAYGPDFW